ncbi:MAG: T9SS type A sorting domain-containing protein [Paludibacter sp.]|nr:T9SS type A sorting domain-containing protein [Paludibacter sp.]
MVSLHFREVYLMNGGFDQWKIDGLLYVTGIISNTERIMALKKTLTVYPSPANSEIMVEINTQINKTTLSIVNLSGKELIKQHVSNNKFRIDISRLPVGVYFVKLMNTNGFEVCKIVK